jgi:hypothetical protein
MARKLCDICNTRSVGTGISSGWEDKKHCVNNGMCYPCGDEGQMELSHMNGHESISEDDCWFCHPEKNIANRSHTPRTGHTNTVAKSRNSHADHGHALTPIARRRCRASIAAGNGPWDGTN